MKDEHQQCNDDSHEYSQWYKEHIGRYIPIPGNTDDRGEQRIDQTVASYSENYKEWK